jgi:chemotaxis protein methyltransferase CheR
MLGGAKDYSLRLVGTDISDEAVATASRGEFRALDIERGLPPAYLQRYFQPSPLGWRVRDDIRAMVSFKRFNLMQDFSSLGPFDVILCRNVAIYFDEATRRNLLRRIGRQLDPDGVLILGSMEMLPPDLTEFRTERHMRVAIYKLATSQRIAPPPAGI